jgi:hypothetical protein
VSTKSRPKFSQRKVNNNYAKHKTLVLRAQSTLARDLISSKQAFQRGERLVLMGLFCSDCSRKGGVLFQWVFRYPRALRELVQKSLDVCVHTAKWAFSSRHWQFINWDPRHFLLEYFADTVSTHLFLFPNHLSLPIRKKRDQI